MTMLWNFTTQMGALGAWDTVVICGSPMIGIGVPLLTTTRLGAAAQLLISSVALSEVIRRANAATPLGLPTPYDVAFATLPVSTIPAENALTSGLVL